MIEINNTTKYQIRHRQIETIAIAFLKKYKKPRVTVSIAVIGDRRMRSLNKDFRNQDKTTDVLSFAASPADQRQSPDYLGEVVININETFRPRRYQSIFQRLENPDYIFYFLLVHGLLHLVGYDDKTEKGRQAMIDLGYKFLAGVL